MGTGQENLRSALLAAHIVDVGANPVAIFEILARQGLIAPHDRLGASEIDNDVAIFDPLDDAVNDFADPVLIFLKLALALGFAHFLHDHLLGVLRRDATKIQRRQLFSDKIAELGRRVAAFGLFQRNLGRFHRHLLDHFEQTGKLYLAGPGIDFRANLVLAAIARLGRFLDRVLHRGDNDIPVDRFVARDRVRNLQQLQPVGANACLGHEPISTFDILIVIRLASGLTLASPAPWHGAP